MGDDADGLELLSVVPAVHHDGVGETLNDGALSLAEALDGISAGGVREVDGLADLDVVSELHTNTESVSDSSPSFLPAFFQVSARFLRSFSPTRENALQRHVPDFNVLVCPLVEQLHAADLRSEGRIDVSFAVVTGIVGIEMPYATSLGSTWKAPPGISTSTSPLSDMLTAVYTWSTRKGLRKGVRWSSSLSREAAVEMEKSQLRSGFSLTLFVGCCLGPR
jgi:hypothetical protein